MTLYFDRRFGDSRRAREWLGETAGLSSRSTPNDCTGSLNWTSD